MKLSFIGLGVMGYPMAGHLQASGHDVCVYNRTNSKAQQWVEEYGGTCAETPAQAAQDASMVFVCVGNDDDVRHVVAGEQGILSTLQENSIVVDHTTTSSALAEEMSKLTLQKNIQFLDAPMSGGQVGAENAQLSIMIGGDKTAFDTAETVLACYAKSILYMGESGAGQATKMVNQVLIAGVLQGISEGFALANKAGLDLPQVIEAISGGAAGSWQLANRGLNISNDKFDYGFAIDWMRKDLGICLDAAKKYNLVLPNTERVDQCYEKLQAKGHNRSDTSVLVKQYDE